MTDREIKIEPKYSEKSKFIEFNLVRFEGVQRYKSIARAIRRGHVTSSGYMAPKRPFNNWKDNSRSGRGYNTIRKGIYADLRTRALRASAKAVL